MLLEARRTLQPIDDLPPGIAPQDAGRGLLRAGSDAPGHREGGRVEGGRDDPGGRPLYAPMPVVRLHDKREPDCQGIPQVARRRSRDCLPDGKGSASTLDSVLAGTKWWMPSPAVIRRSNCSNRPAQPGRCGSADGDCGSAVKWRVHFRRPRRGLGRLSTSPMRARK